jgi:hypothetical protein
MARRPIPRRTAAIELWDVNPVGTRDSWRREMLQFWSAMLTRGRRVRAQAHLMVPDEVTHKNRSLTTEELAQRLSERIATAPGSVISEKRRHDLEGWLKDALIVPGERRVRQGHPAAAGLAVPHYLGLALLNRSATRERYWAWFFYSALETDLLVGDLTARTDLAGVQLDKYLSAGLQFDRRLTRTTTAVGWSVDAGAMVDRDPEVYLTERSLAFDSGDGLGSANRGLPPAFLGTATAGAPYPQFLCPGSVVLMRRALSLLLGQSSTVGHAALGEMIEGTLAFHAAQYFIRGMRVLNDLADQRGLAPDCADCWARFQPDLQPSGDADRDTRWSNGGYRAGATAEDVNWIEANCAADTEIFVNAGRKEHSAAKDLGRMSLEQLRRQLAAYTVNRIMMSICSDVAGEISKQLGAPSPRLDEVLATLDQLADDPGARMALAVVWGQKIEVLRTDDDIPGAVLESLEADILRAAGNPRALEGVARTIVSEAILSSRAFTRYIELLHSLLGGGALPSNEDPKGIIARGGSRTVPFHLSLNDRALEVLVATAALEADSAGGPLSFQDFIDFIARRYGLLVDAGPSNLAAAGGLIADAAQQSRQALRGRLQSMGLLDEFSDSSDWNRVHWGRTKS